MAEPVAPARAAPINSSNPTGGVPVFATLHVSDSLFEGNEAVAGDGGASGSSAGGGGGVGLGGISNGSSTLTVSLSTFLGNRVVGGNGGEGGNGGVGGPGTAGAINNSNGMLPVRATFMLAVACSTAMKRSAARAATAAAPGNGGVGGVGQGGGLKNQFSDWDVRDSLFVFNRATGGAGGDRGTGGLLSGTGGMGQGGGLINLNGSIGTLFDSIVTLNTATGGAGGIGGNGGDGQGGGVYNGGPSPRHAEPHAPARPGRL